MPIASLILLAVVQGLTEFLPVSSKTHLAYAQHFLGMNPDLSLTIMLHAGSLLAIFVYYGKAWIELLTARRREILLLVVGSIPLVIAGLLLKKRLEDLYGNLALASGLLLVNAAFLYISDRFGEEKEGLEAAPLWKILVIGLAQAAAILPGLSRAGTTIGAGCLCGLKRADAVRLSFFLGAVAIAGALVLMGRDVVRGEATFEILPIGIGVAVSFGVSLAAIRLVEILSLKGRFSGFALYCAAAGTAGLLYFMRG